MNTVASVSRSGLVGKQVLFREAVLAGFVALMMVAPWLIPSPLVSWLVIGGLLAFATVSPRSLVVAVPLTIGLSYKPFPVGDLQFNILELLIGFAALGVVPRLVYNGWKRRAEILAQPRSSLAVMMPDPLAAVLAGAMLVAATVSLFFVADPDHLRESMRLFRWSIFFPILYFFLAAAVLTGPHVRSMLAVMFVSGGVIASVIALIDGVLGGGTVADSVTRLSGLAPHPNGLALYLERVAVFGLLASLLFQSRPRWTLLAPSLLVALITVLTFSRGAVLAMGVALVLVLAYTRSTRAAAVVAGASATILAIAVALVPERALSLLGGGSGSLRIELWRSSLAMIRDYWLTGVGLDQFLYQYLPRYVSPAGWPERFTSHPHNLVLEAWLSLGIIGPVLLVLFAAYWLHQARSAARGRDPIALASAGALLAIVIHGLVDRSYFMPELAVSFWILVLLLAPAGRGMAETERGLSEKSEG